MSHVPGIVLPRGVVPGEEVVPSKASAHRLRTVLRLPEGSLVRALCPDGHQARLRLRYRPGGRVVLVVEGVEPARRELHGLTVAVGLIKRMAHMDFVIEKGTELGVASWWAVETQRCADVGLLRSYQHRLARWQRIAQEASLQCGRPTVPEVKGVLSWDEFMEEAAGFPCKLVAHPGAETHIRDVEPGRGPTIFLVGPEGGLSPGEVRDLEARGFTPVSLASHVLRSETAALVGSVWLAESFSTP